MSIQLTSFKVEKLHGWKSVEIPIADNRLVLVGENGSGKTTIINMIFYLLSRQWDRLSAFDFESLEVSLNGEEISLTKEQLKSRRLRGRMDISYWRKYMSYSQYERFRRSMPHYSGDLQFMNPRQLEMFMLEVGLPYEVVERMLEAQREGVDTDQTDSSFSNINEKIGELVQEQVLYLPTYRRIEQDLKTIFPSVEFDPKLLHDRLRARQDGKNYIELVEFGMEDVDKNIERKMNELKEDIRNRLNNLTGSYLREVISGEYKSFRVEDIELLNAEALDSIFNRVGEDILPEEEKTRMRSILGEITSKQEIDNDHKVIAHFLIKLIQVYEAQQQKERNIRRFVEVCNQYLISTGKQIVFDNNNFNLAINLKLEGSEKEGELFNIKMKQLSSGEKQIVSLFSHLYLSGIETFFVLIDEPELSLSVLWQKRFLQDILNIKQCTGLIAVTHSPFIFENELDPYTHSLTEFLK